MLNENQLTEKPNNDGKVNRVHRHRSSSVGSKRNNRGNDLLADSDCNETAQKYVSSGDLYNSYNNVNNEISLTYPKTVNRVTPEVLALDNIFVNWFKDPKSVKNELTRLHENNIFQTGFPNTEKYNSKDYFPPVMFLISPALKVDTDYEIYTINNYDIRLSEFLSWASENKKELADDYKKGLKAINEKIVDIAKTDFDQDDNNKTLNGQEDNRRHSEIMGLIISLKNQALSHYLPNKVGNTFEIVIKAGEVTVTDQTKRTDKSLKHITLSNDLLSIFTPKKTEKLKYKFFLKHLHCDICTDPQIQNIDSSIRIGGPFGDDLILTFSDPNSRKEWQTAIQTRISAFLQPLKDQLTEIFVLKSVDNNPSAPCVSKTLSMSATATGLELKKKAIDVFNTSEKNVSDFDITYYLNGTSRELFLNDAVIVLTLQEHIGCFGDSTSCTDNCVGNATTPGRTNFYLKYNPSKDLGKAKIKSKPIDDFKTVRTLTYSLNDRWPDNCIPEWMMNLMSDIYYQGVHAEGIFRICGLKKKSEFMLQSIFNNDSEIDRGDVHATANTLKKFFGSIDGTIFTHGNKNKIMALNNEITTLEDFSKNADQVNRLVSIIENLPKSNYNLLQLLLLVLHQIIKHEAVTKMNISNLSLILAPNFLTEISETVPSDYQKAAIFLQCVISLFDRITDESTRNKLIASLKERKMSTDTLVSSGEDLSNTTNSTTAQSGLDTNDGLTAVNKYAPRAPPRRKKTEHENSNNNTVNISQTTHSSKVFEIAPTAKIDDGFVKLDVVESSPGTSGPGNTKTRLRRKLHQKRSPRDRYTLPQNDGNMSNNDALPDTNPGTPDVTQSSPFRRQGPVSRRPRNQSLNNLKTNDDDIHMPDSRREESPEQQRSLTHQKATTSRPSRIHQRNNYDDRKSGSLDLESPPLHQSPLFDNSSIVTRKSSNVKDEDRYAVKKEPEYQSRFVRKKNEITTDRLQKTRQTPLKSNDFDRVQEKQYHDTTELQRKPSNGNEDIKAPNAGAISQRIIKRESLPYSKRSSFKSNDVDSSPGSPDVDVSDFQRLRQLQNDSAQRLSRNNLKNNIEEIKPGVKNQGFSTSQCQTKSTESMSKSNAKDQKPDNKGQDILKRQKTIQTENDNQSKATTKTFKVNEKNKNISNHGEVIHETHSRSRLRNQNPSPPDIGPLKTGEPLRRPRNGSQDSSTNRSQRSSSASRVLSRVKEFEKISSQFNGPGNQIIPVRKDIGNRPIARNRNPVTKTSARIPGSGPIQPTHDVIGEWKGRPLKQEKPASIQRSNTLESNLKNTLDTSEDKDVTII